MGLKCLNVSLSFISNENICGTLLTVHIFIHFLCWFNRCAYVSSGCKFSTDRAPVSRHSGGRFNPRRRPSGRFYACFPSATSGKFRNSTFNLAPGRYFHAFLPVSYLSLSHKWKYKFVFSIEKVVHYSVKRFLALIIEKILIKFESKIQCKVLCTSSI